MYNALYIIVHTINCIHSPPPKQTLLQQDIHISYCNRTCSGAGPSTWSEESTIADSSIIIYCYAQQSNNITYQ